MSQKKDMVGDYFYQKKKKRDTLNGTVTVVGTPEILQGTYYTTGPFIAETIIISNPTGGALTYLVYDGAALLFSANLAANAILMLSPIWLPFETSVTIDAGAVTVIFTVGGWIP